jgi:hypothetical protein
MLIRFLLITVLIVAMVSVVALGETAATRPAAAKSATTTTSDPDEGSVMKAPSLAHGSLAAIPDDKVSLLSPLHREMRLILKTESETLAPLYAEYAQATDPLLALEIQKQIQKVKIETELALLRAQAKHARLEGRLDDAERLEASLEAMTTRNAAATATSSPATRRDSVERSASQ